MSRYMAALLLVLLVPQAVAAQDDTPATAPVTAPVTAEDLIADARQQWSVIEPDVTECAEPEANDDVIVVCRQTADPDRYTFDAPTRADTEVTGGGAPRAPDVSGLRPCSDYAFCSKFGSVPPPAIMVDFDALPETPAGSDAARLYGGPTDTDELVAQQAAPASLPRRDIGAEVQAAVEDAVYGP